MSQVTSHSSKKKSKLGKRFRALEQSHIYLPQESISYLKPDMLDAVPKIPN